MPKNTLVQLFNWYNYFIEINFFKINDLLENFYMLKEINPMKFYLKSFFNLMFMKNLSVLIICLFLSFVACGSDSDSGDGGGGLPTYDGFAAGLYLGDPLSGGTLIDTVAANDVASAVSYVTNGSNLAGAYTLLMDDVSAAPQTLDRVNCQLTIIGIGGERKIKLSSNPPLFFVITYEQNSISLILGNNITLVGSNNIYNNVAVVYVQNAAFTMLAGSKITGNTANGGGVYVCNRSIFIMNGGEISGNTNIYDGIVNYSGGGGVYVGDNTPIGIFQIVSGTIYGNEETVAEALKNNVISGGYGLPSSGAALRRFVSGTAQYGNGSDTWNTLPLTDNSYTDNTIKYKNGVAQ